MKNLSLVLLSIVPILLFCKSPVFAVEAALHISDREIVEALTGIRGDIKRLEDGQVALDKGINKRIDDLRSEMNGKFADLRSEINGRFDDINHRFDTLHWTLGIFITIALVIFGFVLRMQWQMHRRQTQTETVLSAQRDELSFIRNLIEKLMPPRGVL